MEVKQTATDAETTTVLHGQECGCPLCAGDTLDFSFWDAENYDGLPVGTLDDLANYLIEGFWNDINRTPEQLNVDGVGNNGVIYYNLSGIPENSGFDLGYTDPDGSTPERQELIRHAFDYLEALLGINFEETTELDPAITDIYFTDNSDAGKIAFAANSVIPGTSDIQFSVINLPESWDSYDNGFDSDTWKTLLHEIGHVLGLGHMGNYNGTSDTNRIEFANDHYDNSIMSYIAQNQNPNNPRGFDAPNTFSAADILALEKIYAPQGYATEAFLGDTVYGFNTTITEDVSAVFARMTDYAQTVVYTIRDDGGYDTLDFSGYTQPTIIDLTVTEITDTEATHSRIGYRGDLFLSVGTVIEAAYTGSGNDTLDGNEYDNHLAANAGDDILNGAAGRDLLEGGSGNDMLIGGADNDTLDGGHGTDTLDGGDGHDALIAGFDNGDGDTYIGGNGIDTLWIMNSDVQDFAFNIDMRKGTDQYGNTYSGIERIYGGTQDDRFIGDGANNTFRGANGNDYLVGLGGNDTIYGGNGNDLLGGGHGNDLLVGGNGNDLIRGGSGSDTAWFGGNILTYDFTWAGNFLLVKGQGSDRVAGDVEYLRFGSEVYGYDDIANNWVDEFAFA